MTKAEIITKIAEETGIAKKDVSTAVESFMEVIRTSLSQDKENVYLRGFGTFHVKRRAKKTARNQTIVHHEIGDAPLIHPFSRQRTLVGVRQHGVTTTWNAHNRFA